VKPPALRAGLFSLALLVASMSAAVLGAALAKSLLPAVGARGAATLRLVIAASILCLAFRVWRTPLPQGGWPLVVRWGVALGLMNLSFYGALQRLPLGIAVAVEFTGPLAVALWHSRRALDFLWVGLAVLGLSLLLPWRGATAAAAIDPLGVLFALGAAAGWALYIVWGRQAGLLAGTRTVALGMLVAMLLVTPFGAAAAWPALFSPALLAIALAVALLSSVLPATLEMLALTRLPAGVFGVSMSLEPAIAALIGLTLLGEQLTPQQYLAITAIMVASGGAALSVRSPASAAPAV
jgi:inner membrane transporter RhtA